MNEFFVNVLQMSLTAGYVIIAILLIRLPLKKVPKIFSYALWILVLFRLLCPITLESSLSLLPKSTVTSTEFFINNQIFTEKDLSGINNNNLNPVTDSKENNKILPDDTIANKENTITVKSENSLNLMNIGTIIWLFGMFLLAVHAVYHYIVLKNKLQTATRIKDNIYTSDRITTPFVLGFLWPRIYIPGFLSDKEMDYILLHEQKHIKRRDHWIKLASFAALVLHWFNPLVWIAYHLMIKDMEMSCDESVMKQAVNDRRDIRTDYSVSMLNLSVRQSGLYSPMAFGETNVKSRIKNVLNYKKPGFWAIIIAIAAVITAGICLITNPLSKDEEVVSNKISSPPAAYEKVAVGFENSRNSDDIKAKNLKNTNNKQDNINTSIKLKDKLPDVFISRHPPVADYTGIFGKRSELPEYNNFAYDIRSTDLSDADLTDDYDKLLNTTFDSKTIWPDQMPEGFDPDDIMEVYKNPGLNVRSLHAQGITGKGVGIGIIDQTLLVDHKEYADRVRYYSESSSVSNQEAAMHGAAVASIAVGKSVGVAPGADLYYIAADFYKAQTDMGVVTEAIHELLDLNKTLPQENRIRVISISWGMDTDDTVSGYAALHEAYQKAKDEGVFIINTSIFTREDIAYFGLEKIPLSDPDDCNSYTVSKYSSENTYYKISAPMDFMCVAAPNGVDDYVVYRNGGLSWTTPYIAGLYALTCQVDPDITPEEFWKYADKTGRSSHGTYQGKIYQANYILDPVAIINHFKN